MLPAVAETTRAQNPSLSQGRSVASWLDKTLLHCAIALPLIVLTIMPTYSQFPLEAVRHAQYAGTWYEANSMKLAEQLSHYLNNARQDLSKQGAIISIGHQMAIIAPHAGYAYSGSTAAYSYESAKDTHFKRVFLLGPSHHVALHGVALPLATSFGTPLGDLAVDTELIGELKSYPLFSVQPDVHNVEHSLELQLPLVRQTFGDVKIVPLIIGTLNDEAEIRLVAEVLKGFVEKDDLVIVSSDFTHYGPRFGYTPFQSYDRAGIEKMDREAFAHLSAHDLQGFIDFHNRTEDTICGLFPCAVLCAMLPAHTQGRLLKYATSQDALQEDKDNSVSYLAISFTGPGWPENPRKRISAADAVRLSDAEKKSLLILARRGLEKWVREQKTLDALQQKDVPITPAMMQCYGTFVTLYKRSTANIEHRRLHEDRELRGCIGSIWPVRPLCQSVVENAIAASSRDPRFHEVRGDELKDLDIEISVLTPPRRVNSYHDIVIGVDGIILSKHDKQAVFLPQVATEFGWDLPETLTQLCQKAGLANDDWKEGCHCDLFQSVSLAEGD
jgi:MEMO1 family protein